MTTEQIDKVKDLFGGDYTPEIIEDSTIIDFTVPINGKYRCRIVGLERKVGTWDDGTAYDHYQLSMQPVEDVEGDKSSNRFLKKKYHNIATEYQADPEEGKRKLMNDLFTSGIAFDVVREEDSTADSIVEKIAPQLVDKIVNVAAYPFKKKFQISKIVKELKLSAKKDTSSKDESGW